MKKIFFDDYKAQLQFIRYRNGIINGYPSRLHYTTDYWFDNEKKGCPENCHEGIVRGKKPKADSDTDQFHDDSSERVQAACKRQILQDNRAQEEEIGKRKMLFLPKEDVQHVCRIKLKRGR